MRALPGQDAHMADEVSQRVASLESKVQELEELVNLALRLLAVSNPVAALLKSYGATESETRAVHALLDDVAVRAEKGGMSAPSYGGFVNHLFELFPRPEGTMNLSRCSSRPSKPIGLLIKSCTRTSR
jgi:hypothetical protein